MAWPVGAALAECPVWIPQARLLAWVDILGPSYNFLDPATGINRAIPVHAKIGSAAPRGAGEAILALEDGLWLFRLGRPLEPLPSPDMTNVHFNDGKRDPAGRFWVGTRATDGSPGGGTLYRVDQERRVTPMDTGFDVPNGMGWSPDGRSFYLVDTVPRLLYRYDFDLAGGVISNRTILHRFEDTAGKPDGLTVGSDGYIWCAMWDGSGIARLAPDGTQVGWLPTPCQRPTSCTFGGGDLSTLFVTTAAHGLDPADPRFREGGSILAFRIDRVT
ncbi:SMP-30/gluconolactonase/LRE family protein [Sphingomonas asaccharolytica]|uniref:SMP-30/gluconolactonase/LRE family protein n=1 Tax=Sphingomonas asaccharolytica TaxID=40681 RepID=UPI00082EEDDC|nr:SMP-30/gluconolactonase/LRE family protein [Sphingomonas asaccharolytica]